MNLIHCKKSHLALCKAIGSDKGPSLSVEDVIKTHFYVMCEWFGCFSY